ncbi:MAG: hypothetical protein KatS3mg076_1840 [Candidatus Binatia bacterium]|nr:MAG: hypothetical protein KatS3mg076_1840 [Candidatus Binatia bacterium]
MVLFVNGLPLAIVELKNPADEEATVSTAFRQLQSYKAELPTLFAFNELPITAPRVFWPGGRQEPCPSGRARPGNWKGWLGFFLRGVAEVAAQAAQTAAAILRMRGEYRDRITERLGRAAANGHRILEKLFDHPIVTVATVREWLDVTPAGANNLVNRLVEVGVLGEITGYARNRRFRFDPYLRVFEEPEEERA